MILYTQFNDYIMIYVIRDNEVMTLCMFCRGLNDDFRKEIMFIGVFTLDQAYIIVQDYELLIKIQWTNHQDRPLLDLNLGIMIIC